MMRRAEKLGAHNLVLLNDSKAEFLCVPSSHHVNKYGREAISLGGIAVVPADSVKPLGATFLVHFTVNAQANDIFKTCNCHLIRQLGRIKKNVSVIACHTAVRALIMSLWNIAMWC